MQQFSLVYNKLFVFLEPVDEPRPTYDCGQLMQGTVALLQRGGGGESTGATAIYQFLLYII